MADAAPAKSELSMARSYLWGSLSAFGLVIAAVACLADQAVKFWLLVVMHLNSQAPVVLTPFAELVLTWNTGISYGLLPQNGPVGPWALLGVKVAAVAFLWIWLVRTHSRLTALALGLIIGGAVGNAVDRLHWPGVMDFVLLHLDTARLSLRWYVFNLADVAIVAGVVGLLYESLRQGGAAKAP
ncbi:MAG TPA: signal peptidase II [Xanthobacteraceae bacterium]|nr:signal peptidase II [Xanthobacteraceae bacterium]